MKNPHAKVGVLTLILVILICAMAGPIDHQVKKWENVNGEAKYRAGQEVRK